MAYMKNAITAHVPVAIRILASVWGNSRNQASLTAMKWFYSEEGADAFLAFVDNCQRLDARLSLEVFALKCEITARKAGWCPELDLLPELMAD